MFFRRLFPSFLMPMLVSTLAAAQDRSSEEAEMFGTDAAPSPVATPPPLPRPELPAKESLVVGGALEAKGALRLPEDTSPRKAQIQAPTHLMLYADGRPSPALRAFARVRLSGDLTQDTGDDGFESTLSEAWLKTDLDQRLFVTLGRQPLRWGSCRIWNPTDFLYRVNRDPFAAEDLRKGLGLLKLHWPLEKSGANLYGLAQVDRTSRLGELRGAARGEFTLPQGELALTATARRKEESHWGADLSMGLGDFDFRAEISQRKRPDEKGSREEIAAGLEYTLAYGDGDSAVMGGEFFFNEGGTRNPREYLQRLARGENTPLHLARRYAAAWLFLNNPWALRDQSLTATFIGNLDDDSWLARLDSSLKIAEGGTLSAFATWHDGPRDGEFRLARPTAGEAPEVPMAEAGVGLTVSF